MILKIIEVKKILRKYGAKKISQSAIESLNDAFERIVNDIGKDYKIIFQGQRFDDLLLVKLAESRGYKLVAKPDDRADVLDEIMKDWEHKTVNPDGDGPNE